MAMHSNMIAGMKGFSKRRGFLQPGSGGHLWLSIAFGAGFFMSFVSLHGGLDAGPSAMGSARDVSMGFMGAAAPQLSGVSVKFEDTLVNEKFGEAFRQDRETCQQWLSVQTMSKSYLDAYVIGSQKGATSEITKRLHLLGVRKPNMMKEWHCFNKMDENGDLIQGITTHMNFAPQNLQKFRYVHYKTGFPNDTSANEQQLPIVDNSGLADRLLVYDSTVENLHTDKSAFLAHALTPHAKVVVTVRNPIDRAVSQFNMVVRTYNKAKRAAGLPDRKVSPEWFHEVVSGEIERLTSCGYDAKTAMLDRPTSKLLQCMFGEGKVKFENLLYITRGLYHLHLATWRNYFPDHRILVLSFLDLTQGKRQAYKDITKFLCIRPFSEELLKRFEDEGSTMSYGQQAAAKGLTKAGSDVYEGNDAYMPDISPETRKMLEEFYAPANMRLEAMVGRKLF